MSKPLKEDSPKLAMGKVIDATFKRKKDKAPVVRWFLQIPGELINQSDFKDKDQIVCQLVGKEKLIIAKFHLKAPE